MRTNPVLNVNPGFLNTPEEVRPQNGRYGKENKCFFLQTSLTMIPYLMPCLLYYPDVGENSDKYVLINVPECATWKNYINSEICYLIGLIYRPNRFRLKLFDNIFT